MEKKIYINRRDGRTVETVDQTDNAQNARFLVREYSLADSSAEYYFSSRCSACWK